MSGTEERSLMFLATHSGVIVRYELRTASGRETISEINRGAVAPRVVEIPEDAEIWRVDLVELAQRGRLLETGSWPIIPATRAEARFA